MFNKVFNKAKKAILLSTASVFTLLAASNVYQSNSNEAAYMLQGASKATMVELVQQVGGEIIHDFSVINAISASLTEEQTTQLNTINPLVRLSSNDKALETAAFVWPIRTKKGGAEVAAFVWPIRTKKGGAEIAAFVWPIRTKKGGAEFV
ncbi:hypothetical protein RT723_16720 [Psychrosphaera aquimarina]|uniref:Uncharacterized protein n=1 Tax=Psychrosphaera aquimarina TaxID=2044854 RepID=A0ABU3R4K5_9GAMM|nr:hypothetical protein [Psychrosphaera aquimarina]MDU0114601.1 hypothetical protein [Psychrosphaera aquimarina]